MSPQNKPQLDPVPLQPRFPLKETLFAVAALFGAGLLAYSNSFTGQFIFDDSRFIKILRTNRLWGFLLAPESLFRPVVSLSLAANYAVSGLEVWSYHAFNLAVHLLAALTLFSIVRRTLRLDGLRARFDAAAGWLALAVALLWLVHPLQTESVTYIWQRGESLAGLFYLLTLYCVMRGAEAQQLAEEPAASSHRRWYALAIMACAVGMACKPILATAPLVVLAYDRIFLAKDASAALRKRWKLYTGLAATWLILAALKRIAPDVSVSFGLTELSPIAYAQTQCGVILHYLRLSFWPAGLCLDYMWSAAQQLDEILPGALVVETLLLATLWAWVRRPAWSFPGVWFFVILAPTSSFLPLLHDLAFEHRMYLPLAALVALAVVGVYLLGTAFLRRLSMSKARRKTLGGLTAAGALVAATVLLGYLTYQRNTDYQDRLSMWRAVLKQRPDNYRAYNNAGYELNAQGKYEEAIECFNQALELNPCYAEAYNNRGAAYYGKGDYDGAIADCTKALAFNPRYTKAYNNRGAARRRKGDYDGAIADCTKALALNPRDAEACNNRGNARQGKGDYDGALADYTQALALNPRYAEAYGNRGKARQEKGDYGGALADYTQAVDFDRANWQAWINKGVLFVKIGQEDEAQDCFAEGLKINPGMRSSLTGMIAQARAEHQALLGQTPAGK